VQCEVFAKTAPQFLAPFDADVLRVTDPRSGGDVEIRFIQLSSSGGSFWAL
jgi:hypothetical protein